MNELIAPGLVLRDLAAAELDAAIAGLAWRGGRLHAGVHGARKGLRRTRAILALGEAVLGPGATLLDRELRRVNDGLSSLRDAQALVETLDRLIAKHPEVEIAQQLRRARRVAASRRPLRTRAALHADPGLAATRALLATLRAALPGLPWAAITPLHWEDALAASAERIVQARSRVHASDSDTAWHRWRRRMRRLSQQQRACKLAHLDFITPSLFDKCMAEQLGAAQDLNLLLEHCRRDSPFAKDDRSALKRYAETALARQRKRILTADQTV
ncbi:CHAD domain-containing protein [Lysobacter sp. CFH 32150]|uniref:CHAD domain-containing protein n=1 Tax=Lysobacter sp. CFH 32150 TaxID=2927128 RepID=UPI001FA732DE|nr:CHAD domain-containing protein [Lysobacter sp. CFH 32150]MCI4569217.1 CHAD domain-containing protein [Lysobacter sp. CFH 32150]